MKSQFQALLLTFLAPLWSASAQSVGSAAAPSQYSTVPLGDLAALQACNQQANSQTWQSALRPEIWYIIESNKYGTGEIDVGAINLTSCIYITIPITDYLRKMGLASDCAGSRPTTTTNSAAGRRRLQSETVSDLIWRFSREEDGVHSSSSSGGSRLYSLLSSSRRSLAQAAATSTGAEDSTPAAAPDVTSIAALVAASPPPSSGLTAAAAASPAHDAASPNHANPSNSCSAAYNNAIPDAAVPSGISSQYAYFATTAVADGSLAFCVANFVACNVGCLDTNRFWSATNSDFAGLCQLAGLS